MILDALRAVDQWLATHPEPLEATRRVPASLAVAPQVLKQDITMPPAGTPPLRPRVAEDRRIRVEGAEMGHGRQSRSRLMDAVSLHYLYDNPALIHQTLGVASAMESVIIPHVWTLENLVGWLAQY